MNTMTPATAKSMKNLELSSFDNKSIGGSSSGSNFRDEEIKRDVSAFSAASGGSKVSIQSTGVSVGLSGLAGTPNIT